MNILGKLATGKIILILLALFLLVNFVAVPLVYPKFQTLDMSNGYSPAQAYQLIASYGPQGRQNYAIIEVTLDLVYPFVSGLIGVVAGTLSRFARQRDACSGFPQAS